MGNYQMGNKKLYSLILGNWDQLENIMNTQSRRDLCINTLDALPSYFFALHNFIKLGFDQRALTDLIPGIFKNVPTTGTLLRKFIAAGKNPLE
jgi:hypothetical protein